jgi:hypothetical protein
LDGTLAHVDQLLDQMRDQTLPFIMARSKMAFDGGQPVQFGPLSITKLQGLQKGNKIFAWADVGKITVSNGIVEIKPKKGGLFGSVSVAVESIPNIDVFFAMCEEMMKQNS